jgi:hypothetical protein
MGNYEGEGGFGGEGEDVSICDHEPAPKSESPWGAYWGAAIQVNLRFGGKGSDLEKLYLFLDNCQTKVSAGFSESYTKLFNPERGFSIEILHPLGKETDYYFKVLDGPEMKKHIDGLISKTSGIFGKRESQVIELEKDWYHRFDFRVKKTFPYYSFSGWLSDHPHILP